MEHGIICKLEIFSFYTVRVTFEKNLKSTTAGARFGFDFTVTNMYSVVVPCHRERADIRYTNSEKLGSAFVEHTARPCLVGLHSSLNIHMLEYTVKVSRTQARGCVNIEREPAMTIVSQQTVPCVDGALH
jgi:hypothetical protein